MAGHKITSYIVAQIDLIFHRLFEFHRKLRKKKDIDMIMYLIRRYTVTEDFIMSDSIFFCAYAVTGISILTFAVLRDDGQTPQYLWHSG